MKKDVLTWRGPLQPTPLSAEYIVVVKLPLGKSPQVRVVKPKLRKRNGKKPPHLYPNWLLCLYYPKHREWDSDMLLTETILPWASEWLMHYELWHVDEDWHGGGIHPQLKKRPKRKNPLATED